MKYAKALLGFYLVTAPFLLNACNKPKKAPVPEDFKSAITVVYSDNFSHEMQLFDKNGDGTIDLMMNEDACFAAPGYESFCSSSNRYPLTKEMQDDATNLHKSRQNLDYNLAKKVHEGNKKE